LLIRLQAIIKHLNENRNLIAAYAATPPNQPQPCTLNDFNNCNFSKAQMIRSLMLVIKPKHVGAVLM
jgi:hypothetical protein